MAKYIRSKAIDFGIEEDFIKIDEFEILVNEPETLKIEVKDKAKPAVFDLMANFKTKKSSRMPVSASCWILLGVALPSLTWCLSSHREAPSVPLLLKEWQRLWKIGVRELWHVKRLCGVEESWRQRRRQYRLGAYGRYHTSSQSSHCREARSCWYHYVQVSLMDAPLCLEHAE